VAVSHNTLFALPTPAEQDRCLGDAARCLRPGGALVVGGVVPDFAGPGTSVGVGRIRPDLAVLQVAHHDAAEERLEGQQVTFTPDGVRLRPWVVRYRSPADLDAVAERVGLTPATRHADWRGTPFTEDSPAHVSVWRRPGRSAAKGGR
jgi:hypothetical protein